MKTSKAERRVLWGSRGAGWREKHTFKLQSSVPSVPSSSKLTSRRTRRVSYLLQLLLHPAIPAMGGHISASVPGNNYCLARRSHESRTSVLQQPTLQWSEPETASAGEPALRHSGNCGFRAPIGQLTHSLAFLTTQAVKNKICEFLSNVNHILLACY